jgi:hypothetical protein
MVEEQWIKHCVEAVVLGRAKPADFQRRLGVEGVDALVNSILHTFLLANIPAKSRPFVTHVVVDSAIERDCFLRGTGGMARDPALLSTDDVALLQRTYAFLTDAEHDRVLQTAVDRFVVGKKRCEHHPNRINQPNWDKIVDYVIAMETLFLTVEGNAVAQELAYRFRLNGSSLLRQCSDEDVRVVFGALKHLYELRSKVVHGSDDVALLKPAARFIRDLGIDSANHQHPLGRLMLVCRKVEEWLTKVLLHLASVPAPERPFRKAGGWEELLWRS